MSESWGLWGLDETVDRTVPRTSSHRTAALKWQPHPANPNMSLARTRGVEYIVSPNEEGFFDLFRNHKNGDGWHLGTFGTQDEAQQIADLDDPRQKISFIDRDVAEDLMRLAADDSDWSQPQDGEGFDAWRNRLWDGLSNEGRTFDSKATGNHFRAMSDGEYQSGTKAGEFRPLMGDHLYVTDDPDRLAGGGYGAKGGGHIVEFSPQPTEDIPSYYNKKLRETGVRSIPADAVQRVWSWDGHDHMPQGQSRTAAVNQDLVDRLKGEFKDWHHQQPKGSIFGGGMVGGLNEWPNVEKFLKDRYPAAHRGLNAGLEEAGPLLDGESSPNYMEDGFSEPQPYETGPEAEAQHGYDPKEIAAGMLLLHNKTDRFRGDMSVEDQQRLTDIAQKRMKMQRDYDSRTSSRHQGMPRQDAYDLDRRDPLGPDQTPELPGPWFHGSGSQLQAGDIVEPGHATHGWNYEGDGSPRKDWVFMTQHPGAARFWAPHVYRVEPLDEGPYLYNNERGQGYVSPRARVVEHVVPGGGMDQMQEYADRLGIGDRVGSHRTSSHHYQQLPWEDSPEGGWTHPSGFAVSPSDEPAYEGSFQLWGPTVSFGDRGGGLAKVKMPHRDPQVLMDWAESTLRHGKYAAADEDYRGYHRGPDAEYGASMDNPDMMFPDIDTRPHDYDTYQPYDYQSHNAIRKARGKPDALVHIYRALPLSAGSRSRGGAAAFPVNSGDWVTPSYDYAKEHGESNLDQSGPWTIAHTWAPASSLYSEGNSIHEWAYNGDNKLAEEHPTAKGQRYRRAKQPKTADVSLPYLRNNGGMRQNADPDDYGQQAEPWGRYMSPDTDEHHLPLQKNWERGDVSFDNPLYVPHNYGNWKQDLADQYGATGQQLSEKLMADGYDGVITHDKYGIGEMVDVRPKDQRGHVVHAGNWRNSLDEGQDPDEMLTLYHRTDRSNANKIMQSQAWTPNTERGDQDTPLGSHQTDQHIYFALRPGGDPSYGPSVVSTQVPRGVVKRDKTQFWGGPGSKNDPQWVRVHMDDLAGRPIRRERSR